MYNHEELNSFFLKIKERCVELVKIFVDERHILLRDFLLKVKGDDVSGMKIAPVKRIVKGYDAKQCSHLNTYSTNIFNPKT